MENGGFLRRRRRHGINALLHLLIDESLDLLRKFGELLLNVLHGRLTHGPGDFVRTQLDSERPRELERFQGLVDEVHDLNGLKLLGNLSYVDEEDDRNAARLLLPSAPTADWLGNLALMYRVLPKTLVSTRWSHVGERHQSVDPGGYDLVDLALGQKDILGQRLELRAGVKNLFDHDLVYVFSGPLGDRSFSFPGRTFWVQAAWSR